MHNVALAAADTDEVWHVPEIPVADWVSTLIDWLRTVFAPLWDFIRFVVESCVDGLIDVLTFLPPWGMVLIFAAIAFFIRGWKMSLFTLISFGIIDGMGYFEETMQTLAMVIFAAAIALIIAIPLGVAAARSSAVSKVVKPVMDFMQTLPVFVYLIPVVFFFATGAVPGVVATVLFSLPPGVRLTELGIRQVDKEMVEAGEAFGSPPSKILSGIQIPLAMPSIMAGVNQVIMLGLSMQVIAGMVGAPGLGEAVYFAIGRVLVGQGFAAGISVVFLAIFLDRISSSLGNLTAVGRAQKATAAA